MASGMNGQSFCFHGYLSPKKPEIARDLKRLENLSSKFRQTQIFIETPYRNNGLIEEALKVLNPNTKFCVAAELTTDNQLIKTLKIKDWRKMKVSDFHKKPAIFLIQS
jgi:16S rRNA (cytidine1402-2'-O)-methyltransferase